MCFEFNASLVYFVAKCSFYIFMNYRIVPAPLPHKTSLAVHRLGAVVSFSSVLQETQQNNYFFFYSGWMRCFLVPKTHASYKGR